MIINVCNRQKFITPLRNQNALSTFKVALSLHLFTFISLSYFHLFCMCANLIVHVRYLSFLNIVFDLPAYLKIYIVVSFDEIINIISLIYIFVRLNTFFLNKCMAISVCLYKLTCLSGVCVPSS